MPEIYVPDWRIVRPVLISMRHYEIPFQYTQNSVSPISPNPELNLFYDADKGILAENTEAAGGLLNLTNRAAAEIFGYEPWEMIGTPSESLVPMRFRKDRKNLFKRILEEQIMVELDGIRLNKFGQEIRFTHGFFLINLVMKVVSLHRL